MDQNPSDRTIVKSVISLAHDLGLTVVAEGVETDKSLSILNGFGCDLAQGYLFGKPMVATEFEKWLHRCNPESAAALKANWGSRTSGIDAEPSQPALPQPIAQRI